MSSEGQINVSQESGEEGNQNALRRVASMPLVSSAYDIAATAYSATKKNHPYVRALCDAAEKGVKTITEAAVSVAQPLLTKLEAQISTANEYACKGLDTLEEKMPILQLPADKVVSDTKELVTSKMTDVKDTVSSKLSGVVDTAKETMQGHVETTKSVIALGLNTVMGSRVGQIAVSGAEAVLVRSEELVDQYLPITNEELAELATTVKEEDLVPGQQTCLVRLGSLSSKLRHRAYEHSLDKMKQARQNVKEALSQLHQAIDLIEYVKQGMDQKLQDGQEKLHQMWLDWSRNQPEGSENQDLVQPEQLESHTLTMFNSIIQKLQTACQTLVSNIQGFPASFQDKVQQVAHSTKELQASFSAARSFQELSDGILAQSREKVVKAQTYMDDLLEYLVHNTPLSWLVGPFMLASKIPAEVLEPRD
uniref:Perilipin n=1 Tax=Sphenodon punctatus TaxID=8508 RepID=A0A8D0GWJ8_SPHPU